MILKKVPAVILVASLLLIVLGLLRIYSATTSEEFQNPDRLTIVRLNLVVENRTADGRCDFKVDLQYYVQVNVSRPAVLSMFVRGDRGAFAVPTTNMKDAGDTTWFFKDDGQITAVDYQSLTYEYSTHNFPIEEEWAWAFPWDDFSSPTIYFWANYTVNPQLRLVSSPPPGFVWNLQSLGLVSADQVAAEIPPLERLFLGSPPEGVQPLAFRITLLRDSASFSTSAFYAAAGIMIVWLAGGLARVGICDRERRVPGLIGMAIAALAFSWSLRQIAPPSPTGSEIIVVSVAALWLALEACDLVREESQTMKLKSFWRE